MDMKHTISTSEARKRIFEITKEVQAPHRVYTLTENGKPKAVILSAEEYESLIETLEVLQDCPDILERSVEVDRAIKTGEYKNWATLEDIERQSGLVSVVAEKPKKKYALRTARSPKGKKGAR